MSTTITIAITVGDEGYTEQERSIIASLQAHPSQGTKAVVPADGTVKASVPVPAKAEKSEAGKAADARIAESRAKAATEAKAKAATEAKAKDEEPAPATEEVEEDLVGGGAEYTLEDAVALATKFVSEGKSAPVKAALTKVGAKRVSELKPEQIAGFIADVNKA